MGGKAPMALAIMWSLVAVTWVFVILRLYTRIFIVQSVGPDDHTYWLSGVRVCCIGIVFHRLITFCAGINPTIYRLCTHSEPAWLWTPHAEHRRHPFRIRRGRAGD